MNETGESNTKELLREEFGKRVREAVQARDWNLLEHWAKQWIQFDPKFSEGFKWLARATLALNKIPRAAYAYGRLLDFDPANEEAKNFFAKYPSAVDEKSQKFSQRLEENQTVPLDGGHLVSPDQRQKLSAAELELAQIYEQLQLFAHATSRYQQSFEWYPSQVSALGVARANHKQRHSLEAIRFLREQLYHFPNWVEGRVFLGRVLFEMGKNTEAQKEWQIVLQNDPNNTEALNFLRGLYTSKTI